MHHGHRHFRRGMGPFGFRRFPTRDEWLERLEEYQRDLEQEVANVADLIRRLRQGGETQAV